jgi:hypothetical protein
MNNTYVCKYRVKDDYATSRIMYVRAATKRAAKSIVRSIVRQRGYTIYLKDVNPMYIDNTKKPVNI